MKGQIRNIYPGGNTPKGFYSYYNYILPGRKAKKKFCIKGGPGTGKSTFMKDIGRYFLNKGEDVDLMWCSSDPDSLDGIILKERRTAVVDGTAPHVTDPQDPGAADVILNFGDFWDAKGLEAGKDEIRRANEKISGYFSRAYGFLGCVKCQYDFLGELIMESIRDESLLEMKNMIFTRLEGISPLRRRERGIRRDIIMGKGAERGEVKRCFAGAITPKGIKSGLDSLTEGMENIIAIEAPAGFRGEELLSRVSEKGRDAGIYTEEYYCPVDPEKKLEHVIFPEIKTAVITENRYHRAGAEKKQGKVFRIDAVSMVKGDEDSLLLREELERESERYIKRAVDFLKKAKAEHDRLEEYYVDSMDFKRLEELKNKVIATIEEDVL